MLFCVCVCGCRQLAEQCEVGWREHWDFLGCYCDLRRSEGLQKLEDYLTSLSTPPPSPTPPPPQDTVTGGWSSQYCSASSMHIITTVTY